jgi:hypothetical protein
MLNDMPRPLMIHVGATMKALSPCLFSKASTYDGRRTCLHQQTRGHALVRE